jgi:predicted transcriptional regulator
MPTIDGPLKVSGNAIQVMRVVRGLSRRELGELSGVKPWRIFQLEHQIVEPRENEVARLLDALTTER